MLTDETVLTLSDAAAALPCVKGRKISTSSVWRWARQGIRGVRLETRMLGGRLVTSLEAIDRFSKRLAELGPPERRHLRRHRPRTRTERQRQRAIEQAERTLREAGI